MKDFTHFLDTLSHRGIRPSLERILPASECINFPQKKYKIIHIAGTNGKGSACSFVSQILSQNGYRVGLTLSPHVNDYRERIQLCRPEAPLPELISESDLLSIHQHLLKKIPQTLELTYYEWSVLLALQYFAEKKVDFAVLETGMGGRWDATNICDSLVSGITTVSFDHMEFLGDSLEKICWEKLQIIKKNSDFLFGVDDPFLTELARKHCHQMGATFHHIRDYREQLESLIQAITSDHLRGTYLRDNLIFALGICSILKQRGDAMQFDLSKLETLHFPPARLEVICKEPLVLLDGAHNQAGLTALKKYLSEKYSDQYDLVFGCLKNRDMVSLASIVVSKTNNYWAKFEAGALTSGDERYVDIQKQCGGEVVSLNNDFKNKIFSRDGSRPLVVCGSFYLCAQFRQLICSQEVL